ncbi:hypothetical protein I8J29_27350 [Paenibacillus sp. MWE-103]|uniref:DUF1524 domain-containing protein n=1 Tax=Paenibacillus artemisiicola TaxID=1172618 RepID=A0ABS3WI34_9BACL|nr:hypothetical protein [Paenibacillus artemisiicola]MBO7747913.1 hypothetical protein [Paenibacillus artemisiicola]
MQLSREEIIEELSEKYYYFLGSLRFNDHPYMKGIGEGKRKFLANLHIYLATRGLSSKNKLYSTDFISLAAYDKLRNKNLKGLQYEHIVPKSNYIHQVCEEKAKDSTITIEFIRDLLNRYLWTATVTEEEHSILEQSTMPRSWDKISIRARYDSVGIKLIKHDKSYLLKSH